MTKAAADILAPLTLDPGKALVLRVCHAGGASSHNFIWPLKVGAEVVAKDWNPKPVCGQGLHGWLWGVGCVEDAGTSWGFTEEDAVWLVVETDLAGVITGAGELQKKCKFERGVVRFIGSAKDCAALIAPHAPAGSALIAGTATAGYGGTATAGTMGTATAGTMGTATAGENGFVIIKRWDAKLSRYRPVMGEVGVDGILPNVPYVLDENGKLVRKP